MAKLFYHRERAPILRVFGDHCTRIATLLRVRPSLLRRVAFAPRPAIHALGAFLYLADDANRPDAEIAEWLDERDPRDLLRAAVPNAPPRLYRALDRAGDHVHERCFYERLAILCVGPLADVLLASETLNDARLDRVETLLAMDPIILSLSEILNRPLYEIEAIDVLIAFPRAHCAFKEDGLRIPAGAGIGAVIRRLGKALDRIEAPPVKFILPPPFRIIRSIRELREAGTDLKNCVQNLRYAGTDHWFRLADGSNVYIASDDPALLVALQRVGPDVWKIDEMKGPKNASVDATAKAMLIDALGLAGVRVSACASKNSCLRSSHEASHCAYCSRPASICNFSLSQFSYRCSRSALNLARVFGKSFHRRSNAESRGVGLSGGSGGNSSAGA